LIVALDEAPHFLQYLSPSLYSAPHSGHSIIFLTFYLFHRLIPETAFFCADEYNWRFISTCVYKPIIFA
jgi:hypothetical protein